MRLRLLLLLVALLAPLAPRPAAAQADPLLDTLHRMIESKNPKVREAAITLLEVNPTRDAAVVQKLIQRYGDDQEQLSVKNAARLALKAITGIDFKSPREAEKWWDDKREIFLKEQPFLSRIQYLERTLQAIEGPNGTIQQLSDRLHEHEGLFQLIFFSNLVINILLVVVIIAFAVMGGSRLKAMRETTRQAERYVGAAEEVHKRFDGIVNDIEAKKAEILDFFRKLKEEHQAEIERYTELLEQNTEHRVREEAMGLRRKGEEELEGTLRQLKGVVNEELRRLVEDQKSAVAAQVQSQEKRFLQEAEAHTLFSDAVLLAQHGKAEEGVKAFRRTVALNPRHPLAWIHLGTALRRLGRYDEAHEAYQKGLDIVPGSAQALYGIAATYALQRDRDRMIEALGQCVKADDELGDDALNDADFREYWQDPAFKDLAEA
jgi:tetratricopeptide (TPR) repeat protein